MRAVVGIMVAGSLGALCRYSVDSLVSRYSGGHLPWGTFVVNVTACLLLGILFTLTTERVAVSPSVRLAVTTGFVGSYSTFSTLVLDSVRLAQGGAYAFALANAVGSALAGALAMVAGMVIARAL